MKKAYNCYRTNKKGKKMIEMMNKQKEITTKVKGKKTIAEKMLGL